MSKEHLNKGKLYKLQTDSPAGHCVLSLLFNFFVLLVRFLSIPHRQRKQQSLKTGFGEDNLLKLLLLILFNICTLTINNSVLEIELKAINLYKSAPSDMGYFLNWSGESEIIL